MPRGKGEARYPCHCRKCHRTFMAKREDAVTCSARCRKAWNRLMGGTDTERAAVTEVLNGAVVFRVMLNGKHVATYPTRDQAELAIDGWRREWNGTFTIAARPAKV